MSRVTAKTFLEQIDRFLYPEDYMSPAEVEVGIASGELNADGITEWQGARDLEVIGEILAAARAEGAVGPAVRVLT